MKKTAGNLRQFLKSGGRYALLTSLAGLGVASEIKRRKLADDPNCTRIWTCADCVEFGVCSKPKAESFRADGAARHSASRQETAEGKE
jgi:hypothetical protein